MTETAEKTVTIGAYELELFAYHVGCIYRDTGRFGLSCRNGILVDSSCG